MKKLYTTLFATAIITGLNAQTALTFDGTDDYVDFGTATAFAQSGDMTIEAKVKTPTAVTDYYPVANNSYENASASIFTIYRCSKRCFFYNFLCSDGSHHSFFSI